MLELSSVTDDLFLLRTASHRFLHKILPWAPVASAEALDAFVRVLQSSRVPASEVDQTLQCCLRELDSHVRLRGLVECYATRRPLWQRSERSRLIDDFKQGVIEAVKCHALSDPKVLAAARLIEARMAEPHLFERIARDLQVSAAALSASFKRETGWTASDYIRNAKLDRAAQLLRETFLSVKEIWTRIGYNHHSNFFHDFQNRFACAPLEYRSSCGGSIMPQLCARESRYLLSTNGRSDLGDKRERDRSVLIVDNDDDTLESYKHHLPVYGLNVSTAFSAQEALDLVAHPISYDAVVVEFRLPDMNGLEVLRAICGMRRGCVPALAVLTADWLIHDDVANEIRTLGCVIQLKPCWINTLEKLVNHLLAERDTFAMKAPVAK